MLKRIFIIALFTGAGQLFVIFALKYISQQTTDEELKAIAQIDSLVLFLINVIALGLQPATMRNLAMQTEWKEDFKATQSARLTLSLLLTVFVLLAFFNKYYLAFLVAPLLALSGDYALYGRGKPVAGSIISFIRSIVPFSLLILFVIYQPELIAWIYLGGLLFTYYFTNILISFYLKTPLLFYPRLKNLRLYLKTIPLGLVSLGLYFIGMGVILVAPYFYPASVIATAFIGLKFYVIFKGMLRILHQAFFKDMINDDLCFKLDQFSILSAIILFGSIIIFPGSFITFFFGAQFIGQEIFFYLLGIAGLIYSLFLSMATQSMLLKKDKVYTIITITAALITIFSAIILSSFWSTSSSLAFSIFIGEIAWSAGLIKIIGTFKKVQIRLAFMIQNFLLLIIPIGFRFWMGDSLITYIAGFGIFILMLLLLHYRKFKTLDSV